MNAFTEHCLTMMQTSEYEVITFANVDEIMYEFEDSFSGDVTKFCNETSGELSC